MTLYQSLYYTLMIETVGFVGLYYHASWVGPTVGNRMVERLTGTPMGWSPEFLSNYSEVWNRVNAKAELHRRNIYPNREYENTSIFHLRCSDVGDYDLVQLNKYARAVKPYEPFVVSWCGNHRGGGATKTTPGHCQQAATMVSETLDAPIFCWPILQTLRNFAGAKTLVGTTGSFAFVVGVTRPQTFVFPVFAKHVDVPWNVVNISGINHG